MTDTKPWKTWRHVVKLDPDRDIPDDVLQQLPRTGTDAILVGGTQGITWENTRSLVKRIRLFAPELPVWQEISEQHAVVADVSGYAIPVVLNSGNKEWLIGRHVTAIRDYGPFIPWERVVPEAYLILNPDAAAGKLTEVVIPDTMEEAVAYAVAAERILGMGTVYIEYSGQYGNPDWVRAIRKATTAHLIYGGGIDSAKRAAAMASVADTVVVGNALYGKGKGIDLIVESVQAVKETAKLK